MVTCPPKHCCEVSATNTKNTPKNPICKEIKKIKQESYWVNASVFSFPSVTPPCSVFSAQLCACLL